MSIASRPRRYAHDESSGTRDSENWHSQPVHRHVQPPQGLTLGDTSVAVTAEAILHDVCTGRTQGAFMDRVTAMTSLLNRIRRGQAAWLPVPEVQSELGSDPPSRPDVADAIRAEIGALAREGKLAEVFGQWGFLEPGCRRRESLITARRREAYMME